MKMTTEQSQALVEAQLSREPQDSLEAAAVLEAWGGVRSPVALELAQTQFHPDRTMRFVPNEDDVAADPYEEAPTHGLGLLLTLLVTAAWVTPLSNVYSPSFVESAWLIAVPVARTLQGIIHRRFLAGTTTLERLRSEFVVSASILLAICSIIGLSAPFGSLASCMIVVWICSVIVVYRGWGVAFAFILGGALLLSNSISSRATVASMLAISIISALVALLSTAPSQRKPVPMFRVVPTAVYSAGLGILIVLNFSNSAHLKTGLYAFTLVPAFFAGYWANRWLRNFWRVLPLKMSVTSIDDYSSMSQVSWDIFIGTIFRYFIAVGVASGALFGVAIALGQDTDGLLPLLSSLAALGLVALFAEILDSFGHSYQAAASLIVAVAAAFLVITFLNGSAVEAILAALIATLAMSIETTIKIFVDPVFSLARPT